MRMHGLVRRVSEGGLIPKGYGVAWFEINRCTAICLPLGLHWVAGWVRRAWHWFRVGVQPSILDRVAREAHRAGMRAGKDLSREMQQVVERQIASSMLQLIRAVTTGDRAGGNPHLGAG